MILRARFGSRRATYVRTRNRCARPKVGSVLMVRECDAYGKAKSGSQWKRWAVTAIQSEVYRLEAW